MINQKKKETMHWKKLKSEIQEKIDGLKDDNQLKVLASENDKLIHSDFKKLTKN